MERIKERILGAVAVWRDAALRASAATTEVGHTDTANWHDGYAKACSDISGLIARAFSGEPLPTPYRPSNESPECTQTASQADRAQ